MSGIEDAIDEANIKAQSVFTKIYQAHDALEQNQDSEALFKLVTPKGKYDKSKFLFTFPGNYNLREELENKYKIIPELIGPNYVLFMTGIGTTQRDLNRLFGAVNNINDDLKKQGFESEEIIYTLDHYIKPYRPKKPLYEILGKKGKEIPLKESQGKITVDFIIPYPPGIPYLIPGSKIMDED